MDSPTKELLNRARKIWSGIISEGGRDEARQVCVKQTKVDSKDFYFCPGDNDILKPDKIHPYTWQAIDDNRMSRHFTDAQYDLFGNVPCGVDIPLVPKKLGDAKCALLGDSMIKSPKNLEPDYSFKHLSDDFDDELMRPFACTKAFLDSSDAFMEGTSYLDYGSDCNSEITEAS